MREKLKKPINPRAVLLLLFVVTVFFFSQAADGAQDDSYLSLPAFLSEMDMTLDEYIALAGQFEQEGIYTHRLDKNASRYDAFARENPGLPESTVIAYVNVNVDFGPYTDIQEVPAGSLDTVTMLVNKNFNLPENWEADDMVDIGGSFMVREEAAEHLIQMRDTMRENGMRFQLMSTYRTFASSDRLHSNAVSSWGYDVADSNWARGGHSEHQTGLAADLLHISITPLTDARFENTEEYAWLLENAHNYGFILRYPQEYEHIHGYKFEPWHWRYVGVDVATAMHNEGISVYEEFYGKYLASDVLLNVRELVLAQIAQAEAEERERLELLEREAAQQRELEEAERAAEEAALIAEAEAEAARAAQQEALLREEEARLAAIAEEAARRDMVFTYAISLILIVAIILTVIFMYILMKRKQSSKNATKR